MPFGQVVVGPPGSGKTVYCAGMQQFLNALGRKTVVVNLDPANDMLPYECTINIGELVNLEEIMERTGLGPNGGLVYALEFLEKNIKWLKKRLKEYSDSYFLFDCPGQVELYTHHTSMRNIIGKLQKWTYRITVVHLVDSYVCSQASNYVSALLLSLSTMLQLEQPHINILSKVDLIEKYGKLDFNLDFYTEVQDLSHLLQYLEKDPISKQFSNLNKAICGLIEDFSLVSFLTLNIEDKESVYNVVKAVDKANGYVYGALTQGNESLFEVAEAQLDWNYYASAAVQEQYMNRNEQDTDKMSQEWDLGEE